MYVYIDQIGCRLNYSEMETLAQRLQAVGHRTVNSPHLAQVIVFNTCAVTAGAVSKSRQRIRQLHRENPSARLAVTGCWATLRPEKVRALRGVGLVAGNERKDLLHTLLEPWSAELDDPDDLARMQPDGTPFDGAGSGAESTPGQAAEQLVGGKEQRQARTRAFIKVQDGCDNRCTFCIVTVARGPGRSRPLSAVVEEIQAAVDVGVQEAVLTGVHLGSYGRDLDVTQKIDLKGLAATILRVTDLPRLRLSSLEPWELADDFFDLWAQWPDRLCPHLHLPLQVGTDQQLRQMARRCTTESYRRLVADARAAIPDLVLTTDLIVGFPGETAHDFDEGLRFVREMNFAHAHIFPFSARAGTAAASFKGQIPKEVKKERSRRMHSVLEQTGRAVRQRFVGTSRPVLWEQGRDELEAPASGVAPERLWIGYTDNYLRVMAQAPVNADLHNTVTHTRLDELHGDTLLGTIDCSRLE